ncbi:unnamed protein product [Ilex paraguariensis]|uniref:Uncharacterized protein n=1 Tax=Ilex paraguariensis TaxID=185542 RepID=A0ABC8SN05_9AQUA
MSLRSSPSLSNPSIYLANPNPKPSNPLIPTHDPQLTRLRIPRLSLRVSIISDGRNSCSLSSEAQPHTLKLTPYLVYHLVTPTVFFFSLGICAFSAAATTQISPVNVVNCETVIEEKSAPENVDVGKSENVESIEDKEMIAEFEKWKSKTYALTVPLRIVALRGSVPPLWVKDFTRSQGRRARLRPEFRGSLEDIFSELCKKGNINWRSALAADIITLGDSWLNFAISKSLIEPIPGVENQDWFRDLSDKWKVRNKDVSVYFLIFA